MKRISRILCLALAIVMAFTLVACATTPAPSPSQAPPAQSAAPQATQEQTPATQEPVEPQTFKIGWSLNNLSPFNTGMDDYVHNFFATNYPDTVELIATSADSEATKQVNDIEDMIAMGVDCIILKAQDEITLANVLGEARDKGILVVLLQREMNTENFDFFFGASYAKQGIIMGEEVLKKFPEGNFNYLMIEGDPGSSNDIDVVVGVDKAFEDSGLPNIVKLDSQVVKPISRAGSLPVVEDWVTAHGEKIDVLLCVNDELLIGALQALEESGLLAKKEVYLGGANAVAELLPRVNDGTVDLTFAVAPGLFPCLEIVMDVLQNGNADKWQRSYEIPSFPVTSESVGQYYDQVMGAGLYMLGLLPPSNNPLCLNLDTLYPDLTPLLHD